MSMSLWWVLISKWNLASLWTCGDFRTQYILFFVGKGTGPIVFAFVFFAASSICLHESSISGTQYDLNLILIFCFGAICQLMHNNSRIINILFRFLTKFRTEIYIYIYTPLIQNVPKHTYNHHKLWNFHFH